jgi:hypothetical protein
VRDFTGIDYQALPEPEHPAFTSRLKQLLANLDYYLRDTSFGFKNLDQGKTTSGQVINPTVDLSQYLFMPGRSGGQTVIGGTGANEVLAIRPRSGVAAAESFFKVQNSTGSYDYLDVKSATNPIFTMKGASGTVLSVINDNVGTTPVALLLTSTWSNTNSTSCLYVQRNTADVAQITWNGRFVSYTTGIGNGSGSAGLGAVGGSGAVFAQYAPAGTTKGVAFDTSVDGPLCFDMTLLANHTTDYIWTIPAASGTPDLLEVAQTISGVKTFTASPTFDVNTAGTYITILDPNASTDELIRVVDVSNSANFMSIQFPALSGSSTLQIPTGGGTLVSTTNATTLTNKAINSATSVNLTAQGADIGATALTLGITNTGMYEVQVFAMCTTADATAGNITVTIGWTDTVGATTANVVASNGTFPLALTATGRAGGSVFLKRASGNITYAVTHTGIYGTAKYALSVRVLGLGI